MKMIRFAALTAAACLAACTTPNAGAPPGAGDATNSAATAPKKLHIDEVQVAVSAAIAAEGVTAGLAVKCPKGIGGEFAVSTARQLFDINYGGRLTEAQRNAVDVARKLHDKACGTVISQVAPSADPALALANQRSG